MAAETIQPKNSSCQPVIDDCHKVIQAAKKALADKDSQIAIRDTEIQQRTEQSEALSKELADKESSLHSIFRNPFFMVGIGLLTGGVLSGVVAAYVAGGALVGTGIVTK